MTNENMKTKKFKSLSEKYEQRKEERKQPPFSTGLAITHEQVSDTFTEGTIDGEIDEVDEMNH